MRKVIKIILVFSFIIILSQPAFAQSTTYTVVSGDSLWKIAVRYEIGLSELKKANTQIKNFDLIYPGQKIFIPEADPLVSLEDEVIRLTNIERTNRGLPALSKNWEVSRVARYKSQDMINKNYFAHQSPTYGSPAGENIVYGQRSPKEVVNSWMNSDGHRANILSRNFTQIGVGGAKKANGTLYWTQMFIRP